MARKKVNSEETSVEVVVSEVKKSTRSRKPKEAVEETAAPKAKAQAPAKTSKAKATETAAPAATSLVFMAPDLPTPVIDPRRNKQV